jgi:hypothetical protein
MGFHSKHLGVFDGPDSDLEKTKIKPKRSSVKVKQQTLLACTKKQSVMKKGKSKTGECNNLRRSARLKAQKPKDVIST